MKLRLNVCTLLLVCCSVLWVVVSSSRVKAPPPGCNSTLAFSSEVSSSSSSEVNGNINIRSLSPWSWRSSTVKNRIPPTLWEAECSDSFCSSPDGGHTDGHQLNSVPVYQNVLVLIRQYGGRCYNATYLSVAVGCTCIWARINQD